MKVIRRDEQDRLVEIEFESEEERLAVHQFDGLLDEGYGINSAVSEVVESHPELDAVTIEWLSL